ncbi:putative 2-aminoethylphosphonate ABC transporter ATP-binding protein [Pontibaca methylaminivorans]|nr:putative 2-aminoethylphosphonate ABC transporter ATP-binding protein [Pontibaca methylaminivorans]
MTNTATNTATASASLRRVRIRPGPEDVFLRLCLAGLALFFVVGLLLPAYTLLSKGVQDAEGNFVGLRNFVAYFANPQVSVVFFNSLRISLVATLLTLTLTAVYAFALTHSRMPGQMFFRAVALVPLLTPSLLPGIALIYLFGNKGFFRDMLMPNLPDQTQGTTAATEPDANAAPALRIRGLRKTFGPFVALDDIDLDVARGEFICFLGPSGCGKTTLLRAIAGLDPQDRGIIEQNGEDISTRPVTRRDFGIVFQSYALFPNLTVRRNVGYGLHHSGLSRRGRRDRIAELLEMVGLADQGRKYPAQLSGGQQQRVALARALAPSPGLLLLDEPLSALDARVRLHLRRELRDLQQKLGVTTIMVTHDQDEALATADRIVVMRRGRIEQTGRPEDVFSNPATPFVASFFGAMNFISANVSADGTITAGEGSFTVPQHEFPAGAEVSLCIRPSDIVTGPPAQAAQNRLRGKIVSALFRGTFHHVVLDCPVLGQTLEAEISSDHWGRHELTPGTEAMIALPQDKLHLFARGAET